MASKRATIAYWLTTSLLALAMLASGGAKLAGAEELAKNMARLGFPPYMMTILGFWYVAGAVALVAPGFGRVREWAYAGAVFAFTGAIYSHMSVGDPFIGNMPLFALLALVFTSRALLPARARA